MSGTYKSTLMIVMPHLLVIRGVKGTLNTRDSLHKGTTNILRTFFGLHMVVSIVVDPHHIDNNNQFIFKYNYNIYRYYNKYIVYIYT